MKRKARARSPVTAIPAVPVVGVGASAGGLEAFTELLRNLPSDTGMAFVLIQHLDPKHKSHLSHLLASATAMAVAEVRTTTRIEPNHVYVMAADRNLTISKQGLSTTRRAGSSGRNLPIDAFLAALAKERGKRAFGVILSGTGSDGLRGMKAIRDQGGATFAQSVESAKFTAMPSGAIGGGVDFVLTPAGIARRLEALGRGTASRPARFKAQNPTPLEPLAYAGGALGPAADPEIDRILHLLHCASGVDFAQYKRSTISRRIRRHMTLQRFQSLPDYAAELSRNPDEAHALCQDCFITVTGFFRHAGAFLDLKKIVFPALLAKRKQAPSPIRIWVPGCSTGEEAYSIAIGLTEFLEEAGVRLPFQVFGTDANEAVIQKARAGFFAETALAPLSRRRRKRFFALGEQGYRIHKSIREACVFARQNVVKDPPFSRMDLISCCNLMIYLGPLLQRKIVPLFHYALKPDGFLVLGPAESVGAFSDLFQQVSGQSKLYCRQAARGTGVPGSGLSGAAPRDPEHAERGVHSRVYGGDLRVRPAPPAAARKAKVVAVKRQTKAAAQESPLDLRQELAAAKQQLGSLAASHEAALHELKSVNEEAQAGNQELETAQEELRASNEEFITLNEDLRIRNEELGQLNLDLNNLQESISIPLVMVDKDLRIRRYARAITPFLKVTPADVGRKITDLRPEMDLPNLRQQLQAVIAGGSQEPRDLQDARRCWHSLRILPSKGFGGEIDGAVMMLIDIDAEKRGRNFAEAIVEAVHEPLLVLRKNLEVVAANKAFYRVFQVSPEDTEGRLIYDLGDGQWNIPRLRELLHQVLPAHSTFRNFEVQHNFNKVGRKVMLLNASEVFDPNAKEQTILLAIEDITTRKLAVEALQNMNTELQHFAYALTHDLREPLRMVVNFTELLASEYRGKLGLEADQYIEYSVEGARRMEALMKALLAYWETSSGDHTEGPVDCNTALAKTLRNLEAAITASGAAITSDPLPTVLAEEAMVIQVLQNLISNSIKYRSEQPPQVHISAHNGTPAWLFSVRDNGSGIDPEHLDKIFGILKRLHGREIPGTGIGLALCKKMVERRGGQIWAESEVGQGSVFKFTIPVQASRPREPN